MTWIYDVDGARAHVAKGGGKLPSRKFIYNCVAAGMRVARVGDQQPHRDSRGRMLQGRMIFCAEWIDQFLEARAGAQQHVDRADVDQPEPEDGQPIRKLTLRRPA